MGIDNWAERILGSCENVFEARDGVRPAATCSNGHTGAVLFVIQRSDGFLQGESVVALHEDDEWTAVGSVGGGWPPEDAKQSSRISPVISGAVGRYAVTAGVSEAEVASTRLNRRSESVVLQIQTFIPNHWIVCFDTEEVGERTQVRVELVDGTASDIEL